jgi:hypothetical protein
MGVRLASFHREAVWWGRAGGEGKGSTNLVTVRTSMQRLAAIAFLALLAIAPDSHAQQEAQSAAERMSQPGPEVAELNRQVGIWEVVASVVPQKFLYHESPRSIFGPHDKQYRGS